MMFCQFLTHLRLPKWTKTWTKPNQKTTHKCVGFLAQLIPQKRKGNETEIMKKHQKLLENIVPDENHIFGNAERNDTNIASNKIKKYIKKRHKNHRQMTSQNHITRWGHKKHKNDHTMVTKWSQNVAKVTPKWHREAMSKNDVWRVLRGSPGIKKLMGGWVHPPIRGGLRRKIPPSRKIKLLRFVQQGVRSYFECVWGVLV